MIDHTQTEHDTTTSPGEADFEVFVTLAELDPPATVVVYFDPFLRFRELRIVGAGLDYSALEVVARRARLYAEYAEAHLRWNAGYDEPRDWDDLVGSTLAPLRLLGKTSRGLPDAFLQQVASEYRELEANADPYPQKTMTLRRQRTRPNFNRSTVSRWIAEAKTRGFL